MKPFIDALPLATKIVWAVFVLWLIAITVQIVSGLPTRDAMQMSFNLVFAVVLAAIYRKVSA